MIPANRRLTAIPIYHYAPAAAFFNGKPYFPCDAVLNFAGFRRSLFGSRIRWDDRIKCNGEHEDFYLNLKQQEEVHVVYLPSLTAEHNHPGSYRRRYKSFRDRDEGWLVLMRKWGIDQYLDLGGGVRLIANPGRLITEEMARSYRYRGMPQPPSRSNEREVGKSPGDRNASQLRLFFRYDPIVRSDAEFSLWCAIDGDTLDGGATGDISVSLRWRASDDRLLVWRTECIALHLEPDYWQPLGVEAPPAPPRSPWLQFEILLEFRTGFVPIAAGYVFNAVPDRQNSESDAVLSIGPVLALTAVRPGEDGAQRPEALERAVGADEPPVFEGEIKSICLGETSILLVPTRGLDPAAALAVPGPESASGAPLLEARLPPPTLGAPAFFALPDGVSGSARPIVALDGEKPVASLRLERRSFERASSAALRKGPVEVTAVCTSCRRPDLLERTLESFFAFNTYPLKQLVIVEDGPTSGNAKLIRRFCNRPITWIATGGNAGQITAIDLAYSLVDTEAVFHLEDDWEFYAPEFIEKSVAVLAADPSCLQIWLRALHDTNGHPLEPGMELVGGVKVRRLTFGYLGLWHGFSFNPGLRRITDYRRIGDFSRHKTARSGGRELVSIVQRPRHARPHSRR